MKNNKIIIVGIIIVVAVLLILMFSFKKNDSNVDINDGDFGSVDNSGEENINISYANQIYNDFKDDVDGGVAFLMESDYFVEMDATTQMEEMNNLLKIYEDNQVIKNLLRDDENMFFSFTYNIGLIDGALGGVSLKEFGIVPEIPMN